jgi:hypothetical protein
MFHVELFAKPRLRAEVIGDWCFALRAHSVCGCLGIGGALLATPEIDPVRAKARGLTALELPDPGSSPGVASNAPYDAWEIHPRERHPLDPRVSPALRMRHPVVFPAFSISSGVFRRKITTKY